MTNKEAIKILSSAHLGLPESKKGAFDMAIKALEKEPCEDCISRQAVIHGLDNIEIKRNGTWYELYQKAINMINDLPSVTPGRSNNPERSRPESIKYCEECDHIEMCSWYPTDGCEWLKTDRYNAGYNAAKEEIALSGEYERAYQRGFEAGRKSEWTAVADRAESEDNT